MSGLVAIKAQPFLHVFGLFIEDQAVDIHRIRIRGIGISGSEVVCFLGLWRGRSFALSFDFLGSVPLVVDSAGMSVPSFDSAWRFLKCKDLVKN